MNLAIGIKEYISSDRKVNQFIKSLSDEEAQAIDDYIFEAFNDGQLDADELEKACLEGEFNAVLVKQGLREADSNELVNVCLVSNPYDTTINLGEYENLNGVSICCFNPRYSSLGDFDAKLYENSDSLQDCMRQIEEEYGPCEFRALEIYDHSQVSFSASPLASDPSNDWDASRCGLVYMPKKELKETYNRALKSKEFDGSYDEFVDAHFDMATERFSNLYEGSNNLDISNYQIPKFMYQQIVGAYDKTDKLYETIQTMDYDCCISENVLTKEELVDSVTNLAGKDCVIFFDDDIVVRDKLYDSQHSRLEKYDFLTIGDPLHEKQTQKQSKSKSRSR